MAKIAAQAILAQDDFFKLPQQIVSTALHIWGGDEIAYQAARTILNKLEQNLTFLVFKAIKTLLHSHDEGDMILIHNVVDKINYKLRKKSSGFNRLYYDLLYLPLFDMPTHRDKVLRAFSAFRPTAPRLAKHNIFKVLNCYREYPGITCIKSELKTLCERILSGCTADVVYQRKEHPQKLILGHIGYALCHPELTVEATRAKEQLLAYGRLHPDFQQSSLYKDVAGVEIDLVEEGAEAGLALE